MMFMKLQKNQLYINVHFLVINKTNKMIKNVVIIWLYNNQGKQLIEETTID